MAVVSTTMRGEASGQYPSYNLYKGKAAGLITCGMLVIDG